MSKYTKEFKQEIINKYQTQRMGYRSLSHEYGVLRSTIKKWVDSYKVHGCISLEAKYTHYTAEFKESVILSIRNDMLSYRAAAAKFDIRDAGVIAVWERLYNAGGLAALTNKKRGRQPVPKKITPIPSDKDIQEMSIEELRSELLYRRMETDYLKKLDALIQKEKLQVPQVKRKSSKN